MTYCHVTAQLNNYLAQQEQMEVQYDWECAQIQKVVDEDMENILVDVLWTVCEHDNYAKPIAKMLGFDDHKDEAFVNIFDDDALTVLVKAVKESVIVKGMVEEAYFEILEDIGDIVEQAHKEAAEWGDY